ncbi:glycosyl hydrolase [Niabella drilacis]|uniref:Glycosyl hydrolases family 2, sugar binding domain n=1 Tax=Niabella drilacis (strain DSM 25811 / CCM 8410 / CCUG 62505 / LMG 26954 / E90) TaxID=1285928 RepID=A0A1G6IGY8_NIADE|nr:glycosyl hydrolase [Niabella drilacis]SDC05670.1 Glycosyl hydrolases family 2, sugar binding domain [Niabella drilacis]
MRVCHLYLTGLCFLLLGACSTAKKNGSDWNTVERVFTTVPDSIQTSVYWYWISDNLSKEGVVKDLQAMKAVGINRAFIGNIGLSDLPGNAYGKVKIFTDEWWDILHTALKTATELKIDIGIFNSPGWSQSGGPWVKPGQAMRYLATTDTLVTGGRRFQAQLRVPDKDFQPVQVLAFRAPKDYGLTITAAGSKFQSNLKSPALQNIFDKDVNTEVALEKGQTNEITITTDKAFTARSFTVYPGRRNMAFDVVLEARKGNDFVPVRAFRLDRSNNNLNVGFEPFAPVTVSFDAVEAREYKILVKNVQGDGGIAEVEIAAAPRVERFKEKTLVRMHPTPLPYWHDYQWEPQAAVQDPAYVVKPGDVLNLTGNVDKSGVLNWEVPEGHWIILNSGMVPTGVTNGPASPEGVGLEIDKMNQEHVLAHFNAFIGEILRRIPEQDRSAFKVAVQDSYETGGQNWTDAFAARFKKVYGYDPVPFSPVFHGFVVGSQEQSDRFLWDVRRLIADMVAYEYVGGLRDISHKHGLTIWLENYGHWGFPGEFLQYGGQSDEIGGEFWSEGELGNIENRAASSAAHIYGKTKVSAESFTAAGNTFGRYPAMFKERGDRFFAEGINNTLLHVYIHQPYEGKLPGVNAWFGNEFNRFNTWFYDMGGFMHYIKRSNYLLQQGRYVADVAYFIGEDAPKMTGVQDPAMPKGYAFDYMNAEVLLKRVTMKNGRFTLPDGLSYKVLVLPKLETIRPEVLRKVEALVKAGGVILGPRPKRSPSLANYAEADREVQQLGAALWNGVDGKTRTENKYGKGLVLNGLTLDAAMEHLAMVPDVALKKNDPVVYLHRTLKDGELYFIANQSDKKISATPAFRTSGRVPELWDAVKGTMRELPEFTDNGRQITVPLELDKFESAFILFRKSKSTEQNGKRNFPAPEKVIPVSGTWDVAFQSPVTGSFSVKMDELTDWSRHRDSAIKYFSGAATYKISLPRLTVAKGQKVLLDLGELVAIGTVSVNGKEVGNVWTAPYKLDISDYLTKEDNILEVRVVNTWVNRLIGDQRLPAEKRSTWTIVNPYNSKSPLHKAGLTGPVTLEIY